MSPLTLHQAGIVLLAVALTGMCVFIVNRLAGFPALVLFGSAAAGCFTLLGIRHSILAILISALVSDFFFVKPFLTFTHASFILGGCYTVMAIVARYIAAMQIGR
jgi:K+-sensing histidine kinase KdpD